MGQKIKRKGNKNGSGRERKNIGTKSKTGESRKKEITDVV